MYMNHSFAFLIMHLHVWLCEIFLFQLLFWTAESHQEKIQVRLNDSAIVTFEHSPESKNGISPGQHSL